MTTYADIGFIIDKFFPHSYGLGPNVKDHWDGPCDVAEQKGILWPAPVHQLVGHNVERLDCFKKLNNQNVEFRYKTF